MSHEGLNARNTLHHIHAFVACPKVKGMAHPDTNCSILVIAHLAKEVLVKSCLHGLQLFAGEVRVGHGRSDQRQEDRTVVFLSFIWGERRAKRKGDILIGFSGEHLELFGLVTT